MELSIGSTFGECVSVCSSVFCRIECFHLPMLVCRICPELLAGMLWFLVCNLFAGTSPFRQPLVRVCPSVRPFSAELSVSIVRCLSAGYLWNYRPGFYDFWFVAFWWGPLHLINFWCMCACVGVCVRSSVFCRIECFHWPMLVCRISPELLAGILWFFGL